VCQREKYATGFVTLKARIARVMYSSVGRLIAGGASPKLCSQSDNERKKERYDVDKRLAICSLAIPCGALELFKSLLRVSILSSYFKYYSSM
jgi:hypothetical protein